MNQQIPFSRPEIGDEEIAAVTDVLRSGWLTTGPKVHQFEREFAAYVNRAEAIAVQSCTSALLMCLQALQLPEGSEVIIPALTWPSAVSAALYLNLRPILVDVEWDTLNISCDDLVKRITLRTRCLVPVHFAGLPYNVEAVSRCAGQHDLKVIDDAAHAIGATYEGAPASARTLAACYSFHPIKNMTTGEGGMIATDDAVFAERLRRLRLLGVTRDAWQRYGDRQGRGYDVTELSLKHNMTDLQAAMGIVQLVKLPAFNERRRVMAGRYMEELQSLPGVICPDPGDHVRKHCWHLFAVRTANEKGKFGRDAVIEKLQSEGIATGIHFIAIPDLTYFQTRLDLDPADTPLAIRAGRTIFSLPLYPGLSESDQMIVISALRRALG